MWGAGRINLSLRCHVSFWLQGRDKEGSVAGEVGGEAGASGGEEALQREELAVLWLLAEELEPRKVR